MIFAWICTDEILGVQKVRQILTLRVAKRGQTCLTDDFLLTDRFSDSSVSSFYKKKKEGRGES